MQWANLAYPEQFFLAQKIIRRRKNEWHRRYSGLHGIGFGVRHVQKARLEKEPPAIIFFVKRKGRLGRGGHLLRVVLSRFRQRGKWVTMKVPTDVVECSKGKLQCPFQACDSSGNNLVMGNACCALSISSAPGALAQFVLGCHHVFLASDLSPTMSPGPVDHISYNGIRIGTIAASGKMNPGLPPTDYSQDAALVNIDDAARPALQSYWQPWTPTGLARGTVPLLPEGNYGVYANGSFIQAKMHCWVTDFKVPVNKGQYILLAEALLYDGDISGVYPTNGCSGGAFVNRDNDMIIGMHMARMLSNDTPSGQICVAEPTWTLVTPTGPFADSLYLAKV